MPTLFDSLQKTLNAPASSGPTPVQDSLAAAIKAKSGKAGASSGPKASNVGEQVAVDQGNTAIAQQQLGAQIQGAQIGQAAEAQAQDKATKEAGLATQEQIAQKTLATNSQATKEDLAGKEGMALQQLQSNEQLRTETFNVTADQRLRELASERNISVDNIFSDMERSEKELAFRKDAALLEEMGFNLAMKDKAYMDELSRIGRERDLTDKMNFQEEMNRLVYGDNLSLMMDDLGFKTKLNADQREWNEYLSSLDSSGQLALAQAAIKDQNTANMISGAGGLAKAGADAYYKNDKANPTADTTESTNPDTLAPSDYTDPLSSNSSTPMTPLPGLGGGSAPSPTVVTSYGVKPQGQV